MDWTIPFLAVWFGFVFLGRNSYYGWMQPAFLLSVGFFTGIEGFGVSILCAFLFWYLPRCALRYIFDDGVGGGVYDGHPDDAA